MLAGAFVLLAVACGDDDGPAATPDGGADRDAGAHEDASIEDADVEPDAGPPDAGPPDSGPPDAGCTPASCESAGAMCGMIDDGCGGVMPCGTCAGGACVDNACRCVPDEAEPNDVREAPRLLGMLADRPDSSLATSAHSIAGPDDQDWFSVDVTDAFDTGNPQIRVALTGIPAGSDYDLTIFYVCGGNASVCTAGEPFTLMDGCISRATGSADEIAALSAECSGTDDSGVLLIHVGPVTFGGSCAPYTLEVNVR